MCCTVFLSMWLSNTSTTAMVMPIAEAVLQQLICTGLADSHDDSAEATEDESGTSCLAGESKVTEMYKPLKVQINASSTNVLFLAHQLLRNY